MTDALLSTSTLFAWHELARILAYCLLGALLSFVLVQYAIARSTEATLRWKGGSSLRVALIFGFTLVGIIPPTALGILLAERSARQHQVHTQEQIEESTASVAGGLSGIIAMHRTGIEGVAAAINGAGRFDKSALTDAMVRHHDIYPNFFNILVTDVDGNVLTATSWDENGSQAYPDTDGVNVADREYFLEPMATGNAFVSQAFAGRIPGRAPMIGISAALENPNGDRAGVVVGTLKLQLLARMYGERSDEHGAEIIVVDRSNHVVFAGAATGMRFGDSLVSDPMIVSSYVVRQRNSFEFEAGTEGNRQSYLSAYSPMLLDWKVFVRAPSAPIARQMLDDYKVGGLLVLVSWLMSVLLASAVVRRVSRSVGEMNKAIRNFTFDDSGEDIAVPRNTPREFRPLFRAMRSRSKQLRRAYRKLSTAEAANKRLAGQSKRDHLTKIANRREFAAFEKRVWELSARDKTSIAIIMMDIDLFKVYNDTLGHQAGDDCLVRVAQTLEAGATRPLDLVARYGGEEFVTVLGGATASDALVVAERMRKAILDLQIEHPGTPTGTVSISAGVAAMIPEPGQSADDLIKAADEALYYAKAAGRNCVVFRHGGEYVTYDESEQELSATNVINLLASQRNAKP